MNQYIITDEKLQQLMTRKRKNPLGEGHGSDLSLADWEIHTIVDEVYHHPYQSEREGEYYPITKQELSLIKNNCYHPETDSCDGCELVCDEMGCLWMGANALEEEILTRNPYQSERDTVLDIICEWLRYNDPKGLYHYIKNELRQKVGELQYQCGDDCQGECSGEVTGTPFCPQPERDKVLGDEHYRNALSLCDNLLVHLEDNDITYLQIKKTVALVKKELQKFRQAGES